MKKIGKLIIVLILTLFIGILESNAASYRIDENCTSNTIEIVCNPKLIVTGEKIKISEIKLNFILKNMTFNTANVNLKDGYSIKTSSANSMVIEPSTKVFEPKTYELGSLKFEKAVGAATGAECSVDFESDFKIEKINCNDSNPTNGIYYDNNGKIIDKETYEKVCLGKKFCEKDGDKYYDNEGKEIDELTFEKICKNHSCEILSDGTKYGKDGNAVDDTTYDLECNKHTCKIIGDKYFDDKGNIVTKEEYKKACYNPQTGNNVSYTIMIIGMMSAMALLFVGKKYAKIRKI